MQRLECARCNKLLGRAQALGNVEIKCPRCRFINNMELRAPRAAIKEVSHGQPNHSLDRR